MFSKIGSSLICNCEQHSVRTTTSICFRKLFLPANDLFLKCVLASVKFGNVQSLTKFSSKSFAFFKNQNEFLPNLKVFYSDKYLCVRI